MNPSQPAAWHLTVGFDLTISKHGVGGGCPHKLKKLATAKSWSRQSFFFFWGEEIWDIFIFSYHLYKSSDLFQEDNKSTIPNQHDTFPGSIPKNNHWGDVPWSTAAKSTKNPAMAQDPSCHPPESPVEAGRDAKQQLKKLGLAKKVA